MSQPSQKTTAMSQPSQKTTSMSQPSQKTTTMSQPSQKTTTMSQPGQNTTSMSQPNQNTTSMSQPRQNNKTISQPSQKTTAMTQPSQKTTAMTQPSQNTTAMSQPTQKTTAMSQPSQNKTVMPQPDQNTTTISQPNQKTDSNYLKLYHYTNIDGIRGIATSARIGASKDTVQDAVFGQGTYATTHGPHNSKADIAKNNYDGASKKHEALGKADHCVEFQVPKSKVKQAQVKDRDVWVHEGSVDLYNAKDVKFHVRQSDGKFKPYKLNDK